MSPRRSYDGGPHRAVQNQGSCCTGRPRRTARYRKRPCGVREVHLSAGAARGGGSSAGCHVERMAGASGSRWRIVMAQVWRKSVRARWLQSRCSGDARRRHRRSPCARTPLNGLTKKSASADRRGRGTLRQRNRKATPAGAARAARRSGSEFAKRMSSGDARRRHRRSRIAPERGCHEVTGVEKVARLRSKCRGSGICLAQGLR